jgi:hypothetical protein
MPLSFQTKLALAAAVANNIAHVQTPGAPGALTLVSNPVTLDAARQVLITSGTSDTSITYTVTGTNRNDNPLAETITGGATTASTTQDFLTVSSVVANGTPAGTVTVGTNGVGSSPWLFVDRDVNPVNLGIGVVVTGTISFTVEYTYDDPNAPFTGTFPTVFSQTALASKSANTDAGATFNFPIFAIRLTQNSFTYPATAAMIVLQSVITPS